MKKQCYYTIVMALVFLFGCQPPVVFDKPQPDHVPELGGFPKRLQGKYLSDEDSSMLVITSNSLIRIYDFDMKVHLSQLDSNLQLIGDTLFSTKTNEGTIALIEGDSIVEPVSETDTFFTIGSQNVLKKFKGYYFVNVNQEPGKWEVLKLELARGVLTLSSMNKKEDIDQLKQLTESPQDTLPYVFSPTRKQFKDFVRNKGFRDSEKFSRIRD